MSNTEKNYRKGYREKLIRLSLACGAVPFKSLNLVIPNIVSLQHRLREMVQDGDFRVYHDEDIWAVSITPEIYDKIKTDEKLKEQFGEELIKHYELYGKDDYKRACYYTKFTKQNARRVMRNNEVLLFMHGCDITCLPGEKKSDLLFYSIQRENRYYTSRELKRNTNLDVLVEEEKEKQTVHGTRINGLLNIGNETYTVINVEKSLYQFSAVGERRTRQFISELCLENNMPQLSGCIFFYKDNSVINKMMRPSTAHEIKHTQAIMKAYDEDNMLAIPLTPDGQKMLKLMKHKNWREQLLSSALSEEQRILQKEVVDCDGHDAEGYHLMFCIPDIAKLRRFIYSAEVMSENKFYIYCFKHQRNLLKSVARGNVYLRSIDINDMVD
ncbi:MAG: hypothetical protein J6A75_13775 [Lachnospiraceae bacterium]|nr:hypothetical protein [Lachnospiraceae bacterium]